MADKIGDKDTAWLSRFIQSTVAESIPTQVSYLQSDQLVAASVLQALDQLELSRTALNYIALNLLTNVYLTTGTGSPENVVAANIGSLYLRQDGTALDTLYVKTAGSGKTGWTAK